MSEGQWDQIMSEKRRRFHLMPLGELMVEYTALCNELSTRKCFSFTCPRCEGMVPIKWTPISDLSYEDPPDERECLVILEYADDYSCVAQGYINHETDLEGIGVPECTTYAQHSFDSGIIIADGDFFSPDNNYVNADLECKITHYVTIDKTLPRTQERQ